MCTTRRPHPAYASLLALLMALGAMFTLLPTPATADASPVERATQPLRDLDVPHWTVVVTERDGTTRTRSTHGRLAGRPVTGDTPFLLGSVSKSFTATVVAQLDREGRIGLDRPARAYLPHFTLADDRGHDITVRQLLTHTSGISEADGVTRADRPDRPGDLDRLVRSLRDATPTAEPGAKHIYSTANYLVLGAIVERVTGSSLRHALTTRILQPLGMSSAVTSESTARSRGVAPEHRYAFGKPRSFDHGYVASGLAYGYLGASADDLVRYARFHAGTDPEPAVLPAADVRALHRPQTRTGSGEHYAMGWRVTRYAGVKNAVLQHTGATPGSFAHVLVDPRSGRTVVVLADAYSEKIAPALYGVGPDLLRVANGSDPQPQQSDSWLSGAVWLMAGLTILGLVVVGLGARSLTRARPGPHWRLAGGAVLSAALAAGCALLPRAVGFGWRELRLWVLDLGIGALAAGIVWALAALVLGAAAARRTS